MPLPFLVSEYRDRNSNKNKRSTTSPREGRAGHKNTSSKGARAYATFGTLCGYTRRRLLGHASNGGPPSTLMPVAVSRAHRQRSPHGRARALGPLSPQPGPRCSSLRSWTMAGLQGDRGSARRGSWQSLPQAASSARLRPRRAWCSCPISPCRGRCSIALVRLEIQYRKLRSR